MNAPHLSGVDANLLVALDALLQARSVTQAAEKLGVSQSATSHKLRRLRELFDDELLLPVGRQMLPTPRAEALAPALRRCVEAMEESLRVPGEFDPSTARREHLVVSSDYADLVIMPHVVARLNATAPGISVVLLPHAADDAARLADGRAHVCMGPAVEGAGLRRRRLYDESMLSAVRADHPEVGDTLDLDTFMRLGHVAYCPRPRASVVDELLAARGLRRHISVATPHLIGAPFICARTNLVFTGLAAPLREAALTLPLRLFPTPLPTPQFPIAMTWHERFEQDPAAQWRRSLTATLTIEAVGRHGIGPAAD